MSHFNRRQIVTHTLLWAAMPLLPGCLSNVSLPFPETGEERPTSTKARITTTQAQIRAAVALTSQFRENNGLNPVRSNASLQRIAENQALAMARTGEVDHKIGFGGSFARRLNASAYQARTAAENIAGGYQTIGEAMQGWQTSPGHRKNLLKKDIQEIGLGVAVNPTARLKTYWAMVLASPYIG